MTKPQIDVCGFVVFVLLWRCLVLFGLMELRLLLGLAGAFGRVRQCDALSVVRCGGDAVGIFMMPK